MAEASKSIEIACSAEHFYKVVTDFEKHPSFVSGLLGVEVLSQKDNVWRVKYKIRVIKEIEYELEQIGEPFSAVRWHLIKGQFMKVNEGSWKIEELAPDRIRATYTITLKLSSLVPGSITTQLAQASLPKMLEEFKEYAEKTFNEGK